MDIEELMSQARSMFPGAIERVVHSGKGGAEIQCRREALQRLCDWLFNQKNYHFSGLIVEEHPHNWQLRYLFTGPEILLVKTGAPLEEATFPSISEAVHAADWHEREAEDLYGLTFEGHPLLGDFILHDNAWQEGIAPMRNGFNPEVALANRLPNREWRPRRILTAPGAFIMPIGPVFGGATESVHFQLETTGEEVIRAFPRLFFKYRGVEKLAEGRKIDEALLLAERFAGNTAFAHALAFCLAVEQLADIKAPGRARILRIFFAELERLRHHLGVIAGICNSTGLVVAASQVAILEEEALRLAGGLAGHRYLFGLTVPGGLSLDMNDQACREVAVNAQDIIRRLDGIKNTLINTSSFMDRLEEVGMVTRDQARGFGLAGPVARASDYCNDLRRIQPYSGYESFDFKVPCETEGDGYARLRLFLAEAAQSARIMEQAVAALPPGAVFAPCEATAGQALAGVEAPCGGMWNWLRLDEYGTLERYHFLTPSFSNWHGFHLAVEYFTFQDFPIILATFGLSVAENDR
ncbi:MAG TPA: hypothetical protein ENI69_04995 [Rhodospirillales bacterium]|nr:hypothetical protein [Rhodospirillales bacterium]